MTVRDTFIVNTRRKQFIRAAIATLNEIGYANASLAQIARRAEVSTALLSYHFKDKEDLMTQTLLEVIQGVSTSLLEAIMAAHTPLEKVHAYLRSSIHYQATHPEEYTALIEILFNARTPEGIQYYKLADDEEEPEISALREAIALGQQTRQFRAFDISLMIVAIRGAVGEFIAPGNSAKIDPDEYAKHLIALFDRALLVVDS